MVKTVKPGFLKTCTCHRDKPYGFIRWDDEDGKHTDTIRARDNIRSHLEAEYMTVEVLTLFDQT